MDELKEPVKDTLQVPSDTNVRHLDRARSERRGDEPQRPAPEKIEARESSSPSSHPKAEQVQPDANSKQRSLLRLILFALLPIALMIGGYLYVTGGAVMETDNAYVQADTVGISTDVSGMVQQVLVTDNQKIAKDDVLFKLDPKPFRLALERAEAQVGTTRNDLLAMQASYRNMQAQVDQAKATSIST